MPPSPQQPHFDFNDEPGPSGHAEDDPPFDYPKINWNEWPDWEGEPREDTLPLASEPDEEIWPPPPYLAEEDIPPLPPYLAEEDIPPLPPYPVADDLPPLPPPPAAVAFNPRGEEELNLYHLQQALLSAQAQLAPGAAQAQQPMTQAIRYLEEKNPARAELVSRTLKMAGWLVGQAAELVNEGIHWPSVEAQVCPEEAFRDTPQNWSVVARANVQNANGQAPEAHAAQEDAAPAAETQEPEWVKRLAKDAPAHLPSKASLARLGRSLRSDTEAERRRFYDAAKDLGLSTTPEAEPAMFAAISALLGEKITRKSHMNAVKWSKAASALATEDLVWQAPAPSSAVARLGRNGHGGPNAPAR
jgi:hypothetical protein